MSGENQQSFPAALPKLPEMPVDGVKSIEPVPVRTYPQVDITLEKIQELEAEADNASWSKLMWAAAHLMVKHGRGEVSIKIYCNSQGQLTAALFDSLTDYDEAGRHDASAMEGGAL